METMFESLSDRLQERLRDCTREQEFFLERMVLSKMSEESSPGKLLLSYFNDKNLQVNWIDPCYMTEEDTVRVYFDFLKKGFISRLQYGDKQWVR